MSKCPQCDTETQDEDIACPSCKTPVSQFKKHVRYSKAKTRFRWASEHLLVPIVIVILAQYFLTSYVNPPTAPVIMPFAEYNGGPVRPLANNSFAIDIKTDEVPWLNINVVNNGTSLEKDLELSVHLAGNLSICKVEPTYAPKALKARVIKSDTTRSSFYEKLSSLPVDGQLRFHLILDRFISTDQEFEFEVLSENRNWSKGIRIEPKRKTVAWRFTHPAMAQESKNQEGSQRPSTGILIGGYDQLKLANDIFMLLQEKRLITHLDATDIKQTISTFKEGVLFGGINVLKFNEMILNKLIQNNRISYPEAQDMIGKSKTSGGVLIGGYNVLILEVEILNTLLRKGHISREEGQRIIDGAKG
jgi:hypothetical protein